MAETVKKVTEKATIDCSMIVIKTKESVPKTYGFTCATRIGVEANIETRNAITLTIKDVMKATKPERRTLTGHTITLTDGLLVLEMLPLCNGGELTYAEDSKTVTGYNPPISGEEYERIKFDMTCYSAVMEGSEVVGYEAITYPSCEGQPIAPGSSEDDVFTVHEWTVISSPGSGERPYQIAFVDELPTIEAGD